MWWHCICFNILVLIVHIESGLSRMGLRVSVETTTAMSVVHVDLGSVAIEQTKDPVPLALEEFLPARYLFKNKQTSSFENALQLEVFRRAQQSQVDELLIGAGLEMTPEYLERESLVDRFAYVDERGNLVAEDKPYLPFGPVFKRMPPENSLVPMERFRYEEFASEVPESVTQRSNPPAPAPSRRGRPRKEQNLSPFLPLAQYSNRFFYARAMIHPYLETYAFEDVGRILSAVWNDYVNSNASDYYTYLTAMTYIDPQTIWLQNFVQLWDYASTKLEPRNFRMEIAEIVKQHRQKTMRLLEGGSQ